MTGRREAAPEHGVTSTDTMVAGRTGFHPGTVSRCICGWHSEWGVRDGSAEADGAQHLRENVKGYAEEQAERQKQWLADNEARAAALKDKVSAAIAVMAPAIQANIEKARAEVIRTGTFSDPCHDCTCFISPPCSQCVTCQHIDYPECENDCQTCTDHDEESSNA